MSSSEGFTYALLWSTEATTDALSKSRQVFGFDNVPHHTSSHNAHTDTVAWGTQLIPHRDCSSAHYSRTEHSRLTRLNPPMGFISCDWSEETEPEVLFKSNEATSEEASRTPGPIPIPLSIDDGKTLDWSRPAESESLSYPSIYSGSAVHCE